MAKLWSRIKDIHGRSRVQEIDLSTLKISSPSVIYLTGYMTMDARQSYVAANLKSLKSLIRGKNEISPQPQIYVWSHTNVRNVFNLATYNFLPGHASSAPAKKLAAGVIMPLVSENGRPLPFDHAQKNLRNLTFFGYSAGTIVAQEAFNASLAMMQGIGYKKDEARKLLHEVVLVSVGNVSRPRSERDRFTTLYFEGSDDVMVRRMDRLFSPLRSIFNRRSGALKIRRLSDTSLLITAPVRKDKTSSHALAHYTSGDESYAFSNIARFALINAVERKDALLSGLLAPPSALSAEEKSAYRARIENAGGKF